ncbi:MAG TPA: hypothetical protein VFE60_27790 [Roseiarcus sp.]|jgi:hypothetical protein|nr:hypothetical protein [Roseiarcus sp.]
MTRSAKHGRPGRALSKRPYRYALALYEALSANASRRMAMRVVQVAYNGLLLVEEADGSLKVMTAAQDYVNHRLHAARTDAEAATEPDPFKLVDEDFDKHRDRCRAIARWHADAIENPDDVTWVRSMSEAIRIATGPWCEGASGAVLDLAASANETAWATEVLLPMLRARKPTLAA